MGKMLQDALKTPLGPKPMTERKDDGSYYAKAGVVWKSPVVTKLPEGGSSISIGFQVCVMTEVVGDDGAEAVAELMNRGDQCPSLVKALSAADTHIYNLLAYIDLHQEVGQFDTPEIEVARARVRQVKQP